MRIKIAQGLKELEDFVDVGEGTITSDETEDKDWINNWKQYFKPFMVMILLSNLHGKKFLMIWLEEWLLI